MKKQILVLTVLTLATFISCTKTKDMTAIKDMTVIKDCTGSYLRFNNQDYHICNMEAVESFENGTAVDASFNEIDVCETNWAVCYLLHPNLGWVNVTEIK